jgi:hypothetical protein
VVKVLIYNHNSMVPVTVFTIVITVSFPFLQLGEDMFKELNSSNEDPPLYVEYLVIIEYLYLR